jgi:hypothetical protein
MRERSKLTLDLCFDMRHTRNFFRCDTMDLPPKGSNPGGLARNSQRQPLSQQLVRMHDKHANSYGKYGRSDTMQIMHDKQAYHYI